MISYAITVATRHRTHPRLLGGRVGLILAVMLSITHVGIARASLLSILEDVARLGRREAEVIGGGGAAGAGRAALGTAERAAVASSVLSAATASAYLTRDGSKWLLYLTGTREPIDLLDVLSDFAQLPRSLGSRVLAGEKVVIDSAAAKAIGSHVEALAREYKLHVSDATYGIRPVVTFDAGTTRLLIELQPGLVIPFDKAAIPADVWTMLSTSVRQEEVRMLAMVSYADPDALGRLLHVGGDRIDIFQTVSASGRLSLERYKDGIAILIGHVEGNAFVLNEGVGGGQRIGFAEVQAEAARTNTTILFVGCETFSDITGSGYLLRVRDPEVVVALRAATSAQTYQQLLASLGTRGNPFVIDPTEFHREAGRLIFKAERLREHEAIVNRGASGVRIFARQMEAVPSSEWYEFLGGCYLLGLVSAAFSFQMSWSTYDRQFPILPNSVLRPYAYQSAAIMKILLFSLLLPYSAGFVTVVILLSFGWREREFYFELFWSLFLKPMYFLASMLCITFLLILRLLVVILSVMIVVSGFSLLPTSGSSRAYFPIAGLVCIGVGIIGLVILWKRKPLNLIEQLMMLIIERVSNRAVRLTLLALPAATVTTAILLAWKLP